MDISRLKNKDLQVWLPMMDGVEVLCQYLSQGDYNQLRKQALRTSLDPRTKQKTEELDSAKLESLLARAIVKDWRGLTDNGETYPCSVENIDYLMSECTEFRLLVMDAPLSLERMLEAEKAATEKN